MIGETVGSYRVLSAIGQGGMGVVYLGEHTLIGRKAAIKVLRSDMSKDHESVARFFNEARAAAMLRHPGLVDVYDFGHRADGSAYLVMELLEGESLAALLAREHVLAVAVASAITRQIASALHTAHGRDIVHRDLKPENVFLISDADAPGGVRAKLLDFGIAKLARAESDNPDSAVTTAHGAIYGTPRYMAPEQCKNARSVDARADIYGVGCILFEMLLGRPPFTYPSWAELVAAHLYEDPPRPRELDPRLPPAIETVILTALAKDMDDRYQTMAELAQAVEAVWRVSVGEARAALFTPPAGMPAIRSTPEPGVPLFGSAPTLPVAAQISLPEQRERTHKDPRPRRSRLWVGVIGIVTMGVVTATIIFTQTDDAPVLRKAATSIAVDAMIATADTIAMTAPPIGTAAMPAPTAPPATPATVTLVIDSMPRGAIVYRAADGIRLGKTPLERTLAQTDGVADFVVRLAGYRDGRVSLSTQRDGRATAKLARLKRARNSGRGEQPFIDPYGDE